MKVTFEFFTVTDALKQGLKLLIIGTAIAIVTNIVGEYNGLTAAVLLFTALVSQVTALLKEYKGYKTAFEYLQAVFPEMELEQTDIGGLQDLTEAAEDLITDLERSSAEREALLKEEIAKLQDQITSNKNEVDSFQRELKKAWECTKEATEKGREEAKRIHADLLAERERTKNAFEQLEKLKKEIEPYLINELAVFLGDDSETIRKKYLSIINSLNAKKMRTPKNTEE